MLFRNIIFKYSSPWFCKKCQIISTLHGGSCKLDANLNVMGKKLTYKSIKSYSFLLNCGYILSSRTPLCQCCLLSKVIKIKVPSKFIVTSSFVTKDSKQSSCSNEDQGDKEKKDLKDLLENDTELRSILNDIMKDFEGPPPSPPGSAGKKIPTKNDHLEDACVNANVASNVVTAIADIEIPESTESLSNDNPAIPLSVREKFREYSDKDADIILGVEEVQQRQILGEEEEEEQEFYLYQEKDDLTGLTLERGKTGVFDLPELLDLLKSENLQDIAVIEVPKNLQYSDYLVLATARAPRHSKGVTEFIRKLHKQKKHEKDPYLVIEGADCHDWKVLDMGNIVLHIFLAEIRSYYQIETLWTVGEEYDDLINQKVDPVIDLLQQHMEFVKGAQVVEPDPLASQDGEAKKVMN